MPTPENETQRICLDENQELVISAKKTPRTVKCDVCGTENDPHRELCRVCSNYLESNEEVK